MRQLLQIGQQLAILVLTTGCHLMWTNPSVAFVMFMFMSNVAFYYVGLLLLLAKINDLRQLFVYNRFTHYVIAVSFIILCSWRIKCEAVSLDVITRTIVEIVKWLLIFKI